MNEKAVSFAVETLRSMKPFQIGNHVIAFDKRVEVSHTLILSKPDNAASYENQLLYFGRALKDAGVEVEVVVLVINGMMADQQIGPVCVIFSLERGGDYRQVILDYKNDQVLQAKNINETDRDICAHLFLAQSSYHPEEEQAAKWN